MKSISRPSVSIVIPSWNGRFLLEEMFPSLLAAAGEFSRKTGGSWEIIVVDDGSVDDTVAWIEGFPEKRVKLITLRRNKGFAAACNVGFLACHNDIVILLNNDVSVHKDFLLPLFEHFENESVFGVTFKALGRDQKTFCNGGKIGEFRMGFWKAFRNYDVSEGFLSTLDDKLPLYSFSVCGGFCAFDRRKLLEVGGFEELMSPFYWEDVELSYRAWKHGWSILYDPRSLVFHDASTTIRGAFNRVRINRINIRNRFIFIWKNLHDTGMMSLHLLSLLLLLAQALLTVKISFFLGFRDALLRLPQILPKRRAEKKATKVTDRAIRKLFLEFKKKDYLVVS